MSAQLFVCAAAGRTGYKSGVGNRMPERELQPHLELQLSESFCDGLSRTNHMIVPNHYCYSCSKIILFSTFCLCVLSAVKHMPVDDVCA